MKIAAGKNRSSGKRSGEGRRLPEQTRAQAGVAHCRDKEREDAQQQRTAGPLSAQRCKPSGPRLVEAFGVHCRVKEDVRKQKTAGPLSAQRCKPIGPKLVEAFGVHCLARGDELP